jgi:5-methylthioadenosine/S-adenosylhomocysteine deaminase
VTVRLVADAVFTVDAEDTVWRPGAVEIDGGRITWVGDPDLTPAEARTDVQELGGLLMPGLVNCHGHSPMTLVRSAGDGLPLDRWLSEAVWPREALHGDEDVFWGMTLGASEMLLNGITTTCEQYLHADAVADAALASGIRCVLTPGVFDMPGIAIRRAPGRSTWSKRAGSSMKWMGVRAGSTWGSALMPRTACPRPGFRRWRRRRSGAAP